MEEYGKLEFVIRNSDFGIKQFEFLGFTFCCGKGRESGNFCVKLKTSRKKYTLKQNAMKSRMRERRTYGSVRGKSCEALVYSTVEMMC